MSVNGMRQVVEEVGPITVHQSISMMADIKLAQFALLKSSLSNTVLYFCPWSPGPKCLRESSPQVRRSVCMCFISSLPLVSFRGLD